MIRGIMFFIVVWALVAVAISLYRSLKKKQKLSVLKTLAYSGFTAAVTAVIVTSIVYLF